MCGLHGMPMLTSRGVCCTGEGRASDTQKALGRVFLMLACHGARLRLNQHLVVPTLLLISPVCLGLCMCVPGTVCVCCTCLWDRT